MRVIVDRRFENQMSDADRPWFIVNTVHDVTEILQTWVCERVILHHRFASNISSIPPKAPLVLVFEREMNPPSLDRLIPLLNHLDMVIPRKVFQSDFAKILSSKPYFSQWSREWIQYYPKSTQGFLTFNRYLIETRERVDRRHWRVFQKWAEGDGSIENVARAIRRHPKTVRHSLGVASDFLGVDRIDQISRESLKEFLRMADFPGPWHEEQK